MYPLQRYYWHCYQIGIFSRKNYDDEMKPVMKIDFLYGCLCERQWNIITLSFLSIIMITADYGITIIYYIFILAEREVGRERGFDLFPEKIIIVNFCGNNQAKRESFRF